MQSLIDKLYKEIVQQQKYLKREDIRNAKKIKPADFTSCSAVRGRSQTQENQSFSKC
jgi:hypothetical protein